MFHEDGWDMMERMKRLRRVRERTKANRCLQIGRQGSYQGMAFPFYLCSEGRIRQLAEY